MLPFVTQPKSHIFPPGSDEAGVRGSVEKVDRGVGRRAAANKAKFTFSSDDDDDVDGAKAGGSSRNSNVDTYDIKVRVLLTFTQCALLIH